MSLNTDRKPFAIVPVFLLLAFLLPDPVPGEELSILVPRNEVAFSIPGESFEIAGTPVVVEPLSRPALGTLFEEQGAWVFQPSADFAELGLDVFRYRYYPPGQPQASQEATAYLVADLRGYDVLTDGFELGEVERIWRQVTGCGEISIDSVKPLVGAYSVEMTAGACGPTYLEFDVPSDGETSSPGGTTSTVLDIGGAFQEGIRLLEALDRNGEPVFEVEIVSSASVVARARLDDGTWVSSEQIDVDPLRPHRLDLHWWAANPTGASAGGIVVTLDGITRGSLSNLANAAVDLGSWRFGLLGAPVGSSAQIGIDQIEIWSHDGPLPHPPIFADGGESADASAWTNVIGSSGPTVEEVPSGAGEGGSGEYRFDAKLVSAAGPQALDTTKPVEESSMHLRVRFGLDEDLAVASDPVLLVRATEAPGKLPAFGLQLRSHPFDGKMELRAFAYLEDSSYSATEWLPMEAAGSIVHIAWWAGNGSGAGGGIELEVGEETAAVYGLDNASYRIDRLTIGVVSVPPRWFGQLHFDEVHVWR